MIFVLAPVQRIKCDLEKLPLLMSVRGNFSPSFSLVTFIDAVFFTALLSSASDSLRNWCSLKISPRFKTR